MAQSPNFSLSVLRSRWRWAAAPAFLSLAAAVVTANLLPDTFVSTAVIQLEAARVSPKLVASLSQSRWTDLLGGFRNTILSRPTLAAVIQNHRLYDTQRGRVPMEDLVERLRQAVVFDPVGNPPAFRVSVSHDDRFVAQRVAADLVSRLMDQGLRRGSDDTRFTERFLTRQYDEAAAAARSAAANLEDAVRARDKRDESADRWREERRELATEIAAMRREREAMLREAVARDSAPRPAAVRREHPPAPAPNPERAALIRERAALLSRYTAAHPDVKAIEARIALLPPDPRSAPEVQLAPEPPAPRPAAPGNATAIAAKDREIDALERRLSGLGPRPAQTTGVDEARRSADAAARREAELKAKLDEARMAMSVNDDRLGESLEVVETASLPETPVAPQRPLIVLGGLVLGLIAGAACAIARESIDGAIGSLTALSGLKLPVLAAVPLVEDDYAVRLRTRRAVAAWSVFFLAGMAAMAASTAQRMLSR